MFHEAWNEDCAGGDPALRDDVAAAIAESILTHLRESIP